MGQKILNIINSDAAAANKSKGVPAGKDKGKAKKKSSSSAYAVNKSAARAPWAATDKRPNTNMRFSLLGSQNGPLPKEKTSSKKIPSAAAKRSNTGEEEKKDESARPRKTVQKGKSVANGYLAVQNLDRPGVQPGQHFQGILFQLANNNFNDKIMNQPSYVKYR